MVHCTIYHKVCLTHSYSIQYKKHIWASMQVEVTMKWNFSQSLTCINHIQRYLVKSNLTSQICQHE